MHFDQIKNFDQLRTKVRSAEYWRSTSTGDNSATKINTAKPEVAGLVLQSNISRLKTLEKDLKYRKSRGRQRNREQNGGKQNQPQQNQNNPTQYQGKPTAPKTYSRPRKVEKKGPLNQ